MFKRYKKWTHLLFAPDNDIVIGELPEYVTKKMMLTSDVARKMCSTPKAGPTMWKKWLKVRREIQDRDNHVIKKAIARMPGRILPSGTNFGLFLDHVIYELYLAKEGTKQESVDDRGGDGESNYKGDKDECSDEGGNVIGSEIGGSVTKEAGCNNYMGNKTNNAMHNYGAETDYDVLIVDAAGLGNEEEVDGEANGDDKKGDKEHKEKKSTGNVFSPTFSSFSLLVCCQNNVNLSSPMFSRQREKQNS
mmetsp:Transcript_18145/g.37908  ORF Transcript_18145/g.37908 Transcript_18145/m.37908 type:complete len:248 (-) Transcript_18145:484-1227(-)